jgi:hypothetical protein
MNFIKTCFFALFPRFRRAPPQTSETAYVAPTTAEQMPEIPSEALLKTAIAARLQRVMSESASGAKSDHTKHQAEAQSRAAEIIASIPRLVEAECRDRANQAARQGHALYRWSDTIRIMELEPFETEQSLYTESPSPLYLRYAARLVYDYCSGAGLDPKLHQSDGRIIGTGPYFYIKVYCSYDPAR